MKATVTNFIEKKLEKEIDTFLKTEIDNKNFDFILVKLVFGGIKPIGTFGKDIKGLIRNYNKIKTSAELTNVNGESKIVPKVNFRFDEKSYTALGRVLVVEIEAN